MSENKFLERLRGTGAKRSVLEIKNQNTITTFANMPNGTSNPNVAFSDHRGNTATPLRGTDNWQITSQNVLAEAGLIYGDGRDITTEFNVSGNTLWIDAGYTFIAPKLFTPNTKFVLKLCGHGMFSPVEKHIKFIFLVKFSNGYLITKDVVVKPEAFDFSKEFVIDFDNSEANVIKMVPGDKMTVQLLCADGNAYATIYGGMTVFTALQRRVNSEAVASETLTFEEVANAVGDLQTAVDGKVDRVGDTMTGPLKFKSGSFSGAISGYFNGVSFYKLDANDNVILIGSFKDTDLSARNTGTTDLGTSSIKWRTLYALKLNNGADLAIPTQGGTLARIEDVPVDISDLSDVQTTNPQVGDYLRWNGQFWYNASGSSGATVNWGQIGGNIMDQPDLQNEFDFKANVDMDNLTDTGANIANWSHNVTNCITEIPQDIILELNAGTLTLKTGSKLYLKTDTTTPSVETVSDLTTTQTTDGTYFAIYNGSALTTVSTTTYNYSTLPSTYSLPLAIVTVSSGAISSIDQVFNGIGYIGTTTFVLPGVKGLIPDGRNSDGTCKSIELSFTEVKVHDLIYNNETSHYCILQPNGLYGYGVKNIFISDTRPTNADISPYTQAFWYDVPNNYIWQTNDSGVTWNSINNAIFVGSMQKPSTGNIASLNPDQPFKAIDRSDIIDLLEMIYPVGAIYTTTVNSTECPMRLVIPGSTWQLVATDRALWGGDGTNAGTTIAAGMPNITGADAISHSQQTAGALNNNDGGVSRTGALSESQFTRPAGTWLGTYNHQQFASALPVGVAMNASLSSSVYGQSNTVQPPAYRVNVWRRTA